MNHYITTENKIVGFDDLESALIPAGSKLIPSDYSFSQYPFLTLDNETILFNQSLYESTIQKYNIRLYEQAAKLNLELLAQSWGYDSFISAVSYVNSTNAQFKADAEALIKWRDDCWSKAYTIEAGTLPATADAFVALLPAAPIKPVV
jgi:hypothetical protein